MCARSSDWRAITQAALAGLGGLLVTDDFSRYKTCFELGVTDVYCIAHARRKFHELCVHHGITTVR